MLLVDSMAPSQLYTAPVYIVQGHTINNDAYDKLLFGGS